MKKQSLLSDFVWNILGAIILVIVGLIKSPIYTSIFSPEEFGHYALVEISFQLINVLVFSWITSCLWRFYNTEKNKHHLFSLKALLTQVFLWGMIVDLIITIFWIIINKDTNLSRLIIYSGLMLPTQQAMACTFAIIRLEMKAQLYNILKSFYAIAVLGSTLTGAFVFDLGIEMIIISQAIFNFVLFVFISISYPKLLFLNIDFKKAHQFSFIKKYVFTSIIAQGSNILLISSDRYFIQYFYGYKQVGIYNQVYNISQISLFVLAQILLNTFTPYIHHSLSLDSKSMDVSKYFFLFVLLILPPTAWLCFYPDLITTILLHESFRSAYDILPYVAISSMLFGMTLLTEPILAYQNKLKLLSGMYILGIAINSILNFIILPLYSYKMAAVTTFIAYLCMFSIIFISIQKSISFKNKKVNALLVYVSILLVSQYFFNRLMKTHIDLLHPFTQLIILATPFALLLGALLYKNKTMLISKQD